MNEQQFKEVSTIIEEREGLAANTLKNLASAARDSNCPSGVAVAKASACSLAVNGDGLFVAVFGQDKVMIGKVLAMPEKSGNVRIF